MKLEERFNKYYYEQFIADESNKVDYNKKYITENYNGDLKDALLELLDIHVRTDLYEHDRSKYINNVTKEFIGTGRVDLRGINIDSADDLATLCKICRSTKFESFRFLYVKGDEIIGSDVISDRIPDLCDVIPKKPYISNSDEKIIYYYTSKMKRLGADGYYLLHNHPSGDMSPSKIDISTTQMFKNLIDGFRGHIVVGTDKASFIDTDLNYHIIAIDDGVKFKDDSLLNGVDKVIKTGKAYFEDKNSTLILYSTSQGNLLGVEELKNNSFNDDNVYKYISNRKRELGAQSAFLYTSDEDIFNKSLTQIVFHLFTDVLLDKNGTVISGRTDMNVSPSAQDYNSLGHSNSERKVYKG